ncbi:MAG: hypothetical protein ACRDJM_09265 [Actinomycetota bacterium]
MTSIALVASVGLVSEPASAWTAVPYEIPTAGGFSGAQGDLTKVSVSTLTGGITSTCPINKVHSTTVCSTGDGNFKLWSRPQESNVCAGVDVYTNRLGQQTNVPMTCKVTKNDGSGRGEASVDVYHPEGCNQWQMTITSSNVYFSDSLDVAWRLHGTITALTYSHVGTDDRWTVRWEGDGFAHDSSGATWILEDFNFAGELRATANCGDPDSQDDITQFAIDSLTGDGVSRKL